MRSAPARVKITVIPAKAGIQGLFVGVHAGSNKKSPGKTRAFLSLQRGSVKNPGLSDDYLRFFRVAFLRFGAALRLTAFFRFGAAFLRLTAFFRFGAAFLRLTAFFRFGAAFLRLTAFFRFGAAFLRLTAFFLFGAAFLRLTAFFLFGAAFLRLTTFFRFGAAFLFTTRFFVAFFLAAIPLPPCIKLPNVSINKNNQITSIF